MHRPSRRFHSDQVDGNGLQAAVNKMGATTDTEVLLREEARKLDHGARSWSLCMQRLLESGLLLLPPPNRWDGKIGRKDGQSDLI